MTNTETNMDTSILEAMLRQEVAYVGKDYLYQDQLPDSVIKGPLESIENDRAKMVGWMYQVSDFCRFSRETVSIATSYFDRYLGQESAAETLSNTDLFQLAAMSCFYTAAKIHEPESFEPWMLSKMSRGLYTPEQVEKMELVILEGVQWRVNPPTALAFVREFLTMLPESYVSSSLKPAIYDLCKFQTELSVRMYEFVSVKASTIALAALINALESLGMDYASLGFVEAHLARIVKSSGMILDVSGDIQNRLYQAVTEFSGVHQEASTNTSCPAKQTLRGKRCHYNTSPCAVQIFTTA